MDKVFTGIGIAIASLIVLFVIAVFAGTLVFWIWPHVIPFAFPGLVAGGFVVAKLAWWKAVLLTWLFGILFKGGSSSSSSSSN